MPGILTNAGILQDGKLTESAWNAYVNDVKQALSTGEGPLPFDFPCDQELEPTPGAQQLDLANKLTFPDFYNIWFPRYENMALSLDVEGDKPLAGAGIFDPTAAAADLGVTLSGAPSPADIIAQIGALAPSKGDPKVLIPALTIIFGPDASPEMIAAEVAFKSTGDESGLKIIKEIIAPPIPPPPPIPGISIPTKPGIENYTDQLKYEVALGLSPQKVHIEMMKTLANPLEVPGILSGLPTSLIEVACQAANASKPKKGAESGAMDTSSTEKAAERTLIQHQVRLQTLVSLGTTLGNGLFVKGLASGPIGDGPGLGLLAPPLPEQPPEPPSTFTGEVPKKPCPQKLIDHHKYGRSVILTASQNIFPKRQLNPIELQIVQAVAKIESAYGRANPPNIPSSVVMNNWGGVQCGAVKPPGTNCVPSIDKFPNDKIYPVPFVQYPTPDDGCADTIRHIIGHRQSVATLLSYQPASDDNPGPYSKTVTLFRVAYTLRRTTYYGGFCPAATKKYGQGVGISYKTPDLNEGTKACAKEAITDWVNRARQILNEALAANCLNEPWAMPIGTYEDADEWYRNNFSVF